MEIFRHQKIPDFDEEEESFSRLQRGSAASFRVRSG
jgi:hypothetical protein